VGSEDSNVCYAYSKFYCFTGIRTLKTGARSQGFWMEDRGIEVRTADFLPYTDHSPHLVSTQLLPVVATALSPGVMRKGRYKYVAHPTSTEIKMGGTLYFLLPKSLCLIKYRSNSSVFEDMINYNISN
jgi:hypothetical protein